MHTRCKEEIKYQIDIECEELIYDEVMPAVYDDVHIATVEDSVRNIIVDILNLINESVRLYHVGGVNNGH